MQRSEGFLVPSLPPQPPLDLFCGEQERGEHRIYKQMAARKALRAAASPGEENLRAEIKSPGEAGSSSLPHAQAPRGLCSGHTSRWSTRRARCPRSLQRASAIAAQGKSGVNAGKTPPRPIPPFQPQEGLQNNPAPPPVLVAGPFCSLLPTIVLPHKTAPSLFSF